jgi:hypothetical protein
LNFIVKPPVRPEIHYMGAPLGSLLPASGGFEGIRRCDLPYLDYLVNQDGKKRTLETKDLRDQKTTPLTPMSFIYN